MGGGRSLLSAAGRGGTGSGVFQVPGKSLDSCSLQLLQGCSAALLSGRELSVSHEGSSGHGMHLIQRRVQSGHFPNSLTAEDAESGPLLC